MVRIQRKQAMVARNKFSTVARLDACQALQEGRRRRSERKESRTTLQVMGEGARLQLQAIDEPKIRKVVAR